MFSLQLIDLRRPPESVNAPSEDVNAKSASEKAATLDQVSKQANDLSSLVRKKAQPSSSGVKRELHTTEESEGTKRAKTEDPA